MLAFFLNVFKWCYHKLAQTNQTNKIFPSSKMVTHELAKTHNIEKATVEHSRHIVYC